MELGRVGSESSLFAQLSQELMSASGEDSTMRAVVDRAVATVGPCDFAGLTLRRRRSRFETVAATDDVVLTLDRRQYLLNEGPCVDAALHEDHYVANDLSDERRWPRWSSAAVEAGVLSVLSVNLATRTETLGALNFYAKAAKQWTADAVDTGVVFAAHAAVALSAARQQSGLWVAVESRHHIGVAQGILMTRYDLSLDGSFEVLRRLSSSNNIKLRDVATLVVQHGAIPEELASTHGHDPETV